MNTKQVLLFAGIVVVGCAAIVWALERFEIAKLHSEVESYLDKYERFKIWEAEHGI